ncbi:hypothetical protein PENNAL_c0006G04773 [Penicillium nalgiovense]|uniref:Helicase C-terminal domain-containing protein n=1 Tax=Penicillium nalgiovense TaxID=60175 RepID=A0A1V6Z0J1_PENNA|nr:hypothetical protein PENNAL_c0006G04773 [Penicillium nalgiovense]
MVKTASIATNCTSLVRRFPRASREIATSSLHVCLGPVDAGRPRLALLTLPAQKTWTPSMSSQTQAPSSRLFDCGVMREYPPNGLGVQQRKTLTPIPYDVGKPAVFPVHTSASLGQGLFGRLEDFSSKEPLALFPKPLSWYVSDHFVKCVIFQQLADQTVMRPLDKKHYGHHQKLLIVDSVPINAWYIEKVLSAALVDAKTLHSSLDQQQRDLLVKRFNDPRGELKILMTYDVGSVGLNLHKARNCVVLTTPGRSWS